MAEHAFLRCLAIGDQPKLDDSVFGRGSFAAAENLAVVYRAQNQPSKADEYQALSQRLRARPAAR